MFKDVLKSCLEQIELEINDEQADRLERFAAFLLEKNKQFNLTAVKTMEEAAVRHMADSLFLLKCADLKGKSILDVGTGGGFPGMPLKLYEPSLDITMLDSTAKRIDFIREAAAREGIEVKAVTARAEEAATGELRGAFDIVTSRAVAPLNILTELSMGFLKVGGLFMPMKSRNEAAELELAEAKKAIEVMGGRLVGARKYSFEGESPRQVLFIEKTAPTPEGYPRKYSRISKKPL